MSRLIGSVCFAACCFITLRHAAAEEKPPTVTVDAPWEAVFDRTDGWIGGDAIYSTPLPGGDVLWMFADTFLGQVRDGRRQKGVRMVNNTLARHALSQDGTPPEPESVRFRWGAMEDAQRPKAWIEPDRKLTAGRAQHGDWYWLADATLAPDAEGRDRLVMFLWRTARALDNGLGFRTAGNALAIVDNPGDDWSAWQPRQYAIPDSFSTRDRDDTTPTTEILWGSEVLLDAGPDGKPVLYIFGCRLPQKAANELVLAMAPAGKVEDVARWKFRTADGWSENLRDAAALATFLTTEFSVTPRTIAGKKVWVLIHSEPFFGTRIMARTAPAMHGPWSSARPIYQVPHIDRDKKHFTYAAKAHPELSKPDELLVSYVVNSFDFGESATNAGIYRPRFIRVPLSVLPTVPAP